MKSEDLSNMYTSDGDVHFSGDEEGRIQEASLDSSLIPATVGAWKKMCSPLVKRNLIWERRLHIH